MYKSLECKSISSMIYIKYTYICVNMYLYANIFSSYLSCKINYVVYDYLIQIIALTFLENFFNRQETERYADIFHTFHVLIPCSFLTADLKEFLLYL